jgi:hypothetical protein
MNGGDSRRCSDGDGFLSKQEMFSYIPREELTGSWDVGYVVMGLEGVGINTTPPVITDGAVLAIDGGVMIGTHLLKSTNQGIDVAGVRLDDGDLISNTSISDLVLQRVGEDHTVVLQYRTTNLSKWQRSGTSRS